VESAAWFAEATPSWLNAACARLARPSWLSAGCVNDALCVSAANPSCDSAGCVNDANPECDAVGVTSVTETRDAVPVCRLNAAVGCVASVAPACESEPVGCVEAVNPL
jgi:hypothetical protein